MFYSPLIKFIPLLESNRHIIEVGMWVIKQAMQQAVAWQKTYGRILPSSCQRVSFTAIRCMSLSVQ